jgi:hypothetical protein
VIAIVEVWRCPCIDHELIEIWTVLVKYFVDQGVFERFTVEEFKAL